MFFRIWSIFIYTFFQRMFLLSFSLFLFRQGKINIFIVIFVKNNLTFSRFKEAKSAMGEQEMNQIVGLTLFPGQVSKDLHLQSWKLAMRSLNAFCTIVRLT